MNLNKFILSVNIQHLLSTTLYMELIDISELRRFFNRRYLVITPKNYNIIVKFSQIYSCMFENFNWGISIEKWETSENLEQLFKLLNSFKLIEKFQLTKNATDLFASIIQIIKNYTNLKELHLNNCGLVDESITEIKKYIVNPNKLEMLNVCNNTLRIGAVQDLAKYFQGLTILEFTIGNNIEGIQIIKLDRMRKSRNNKTKKEPKELWVVVNLMSQAIELNNSEAQLLLGTCYQYGEFVEQDGSKAIELFYKSAQQMNSFAQFNLGMCYKRGIGVEKNTHKAVKFFRQAAEQDEVNAQTNLGVCYINGDGVEKNPKQGFEWFRKAANKGSADAQHNLAKTYLHGIGVETNPRQAVEWLNKAALQGHVEALHNLGICYHNGDGVAKDEGKAAEYFRKAAKHGYNDSIRALSLIENKLLCHK